MEAALVIWSPRKLSGSFGSATLWANGIAESQRCNASSKMLTSLTEHMHSVILYGELSLGKKIFKKGSKNESIHRRLERG